VKHEKNISAQQNQTRQKAWFSQTHVHQEWAQNRQPQTGEGSQAFDRIETMNTTSIRGRLTKADKLLKRREFLALLHTGRSVSDRYFLLSYGPNELGHSRLGITVTKRVGNAVIRNRLKRLMREYFRANRSRIKRDLDINIVVKKPAADISFEKAKVSLHGLVDRIGGD
jgi:ribonuclease P protein component